MPSPTQQLATLRPELAGSFEEFDLEMNAAGFIAQLVAPVIEVPQVSGTFGRIPLKESLNRKSKRRDRGGYARSSFNFAPDTYETFEYGLEEEVNPKDEKMYRNYFDLELVVARRLMNGLMAGYEERVAAILNDTGVFEDDACAATWLDYENALPIDDVEAQSQAFYDACGMWPNTLILTRKQFRNLRQSQQIIERIKHWGGDDPKTRGVSRAMLGDLFDVNQVLISNCVHNTANEGQDPALANIWDDDKAVLALVNPSQDVQTPTVIRSFNWSLDSDLAGIFESYSEAATRTEWLRGRHQTGEKVMYAPLARIITGVGAAV